jgi:hypothetical protein
MKVCFILLSFLLLIPAFAKDEQSEVTAVKAGKILTMSGAPITDGIILIKDGKITDIGTGIEMWMQVACLRFAVT